MSGLPPESFWLTNSQVTLMLGVQGHALRTAALDPHIFDQALSHSQPHPGHLFTLASSCVYWALVPPLHQRPISWDPPPFPPIACWEPLGGSSLSWISSLPSLPFRKLNLKKLLPIWGKLIQGSQGDSPLPSRAGQFKLKISVCLRKIQPRGLYDYTYIADGETEDERVSLIPQRQVAQERRRLQVF